MKRLVTLLTLVAVILVPVAAFANTAGRDCLQTGCAGSGATTSMSLNSYTSSVRQAATNYTSSVQQPPSLTNVSNAHGAARASINSAKAVAGTTQTVATDRLIQRHWSGGYPSGGILITKE